MTELLECRPQIPTAGIPRSVIRSIAARAWTQSASPAAAAIDRRSSKIRRALPIVASEKLHRDQMPGGSDRNRQSGKGLNSLGFLHNLAFDATAREEEIDNESLGCYESDRGQATLVVFDESRGGVTPANQGMDHGLGNLIVRRRHRQIDVPG